MLLSEICELWAAAWSSCLSPPTRFPSDLLRTVCLSCFKALNGSFQAPTDLFVPPPDPFFVLPSSVCCIAPLKDVVPAFCRHTRYRWIILLASFYPDPNPNVQNLSHPGSVFFLFCFRCCVGSTSPISRPTGGPGSEGKRSRRRAFRTCGAWTSVFSRRCSVGFR